MFDSLYAPLAAFVAVLEAGLGALLAVLATRAALARRRSALAPAGEETWPLLVTAGGVLTALAVVSWPLLHLLLQSLVPLWPEAMCVQGVRNVGAGSPGAAGLLPTLIAALSVTKPAVVFVAGAWLALHLADRATRTGPLAARAFAALAVLGSVAAVDAGTELSYLAIEKRDVPLSGGCCTLSVGDVRTGRGPLAFAAATPAGADRATTAAHFALSALLAAGAALWARRRGGPVPAPAWAPALLVAAAAALPVAVAFAQDVAAPAFLHRPLHRCGWCLLAEAPESVVGAGLYLLGPFAVGWAAVLAYGARGTEAAPAAGGRAGKALVAAAFGWTAAALFAASGLAVA